MTNKGNTITFNIEIKNTYFNFFYKIAQTYYYTDLHSRLLYRSYRKYSFYRQCF